MPRSTGTLVGGSNTTFAAASGRQDLLVTDVEDKGGVTRWTTLLPDTSIAITFRCAMPNLLLLVLESPAVECFTGGQPVEVDLGHGDDRFTSLSAGDFEVDARPGADRVLLGAGRDLVLGDEDGDDLDGGAEDDTLEGGPGDDVLRAAKEAT